MLQELLDTISNLKEKAEKEIDKIDSEQKFKEIKSRFLGKKSELNKIFRHFKDLDADGKKQLGKAANELKNELNGIIFHPESNQLYEFNFTIDSQLNNFYYHLKFINEKVSFFYFNYPVLCRM
jgi:phenylalanyl-tRNA synthetase alpha subunit